MTPPRVYLAAVPRRAQVGIVGAVVDGLLNMVRLMDYRFFCNVEYSNVNTSSSSLISCAPLNVLRLTNPCHFLSTLLLTNAEVHVPLPNSVSPLYL